MWRIDPGLGVGRATRTASGPAGGVAGREAAERTGRAGATSGRTDAAPDEAGRTDPEPPNGRNHTPADKPDRDDRNNAAADKADRDNHDDQSREATRPGTPAAGGNPLTGTRADTEPLADAGDAGDRLAALVARAANAPIGLIHFV